MQAARAATGMGRKTYAIKAGSGCPLLWMNGNEAMISGLPEEGLTRVCCRLRGWCVQAP